MARSTVAEALRLLDAGDLEGARVVLVRALDGEP